MVEAGTSLEVRKSILPVRIWKGACRIVREICGQMATSQFWLDLIKTVARDMVVSFAQAFGGRMIVYGEKGMDPELRDRMSPARTQAARSAAGSAFSGGYTPPSQEYRNYPVPSSFSSSSRSASDTFPGFPST